MSSISQLIDSTFGRPNVGSNVYFRQIVTELSRLLVEKYVFAPRPYTCIRTLCGSEMYEDFLSLLYHPLYSRFHVHIMYKNCTKKITKVSKMFEYLNTKLHLILQSIKIKFKKPQRFASFIAKNTKHTCSSE